MEVDMLVLVLPLVELVIHHPQLPLKENQVVMDYQVPQEVVVVLAVVEQAQEDKILKTPRFIILVELVVSEQ